MIDISYTERSLPYKPASAKGSGKRSAKPEQAEDSASGKGEGRKRKLQEAQEA